jgi:FSR family fosmidomycin resistance protein-like MFS transporter
MLASACGMILGGFLGARTAQHEKVIAIAFACAGLISVLVATGAVPTGLTMLLLALIGFGAGIAGPSRDLMVRAAAPPNATGRVYGIVYSGLDVGLSAAPLLFGGLMDTHHPSGVFIMIGVFQSLALFTALGIGSRRPSPKKLAGVT